MPCLRHYVGPSWPPRVGAYDYALALCHSDLAWEFLRRNPDYQRDYRLSRRGRQHTRRLKSGHQLTRVRRYALRSAKWGLHPFVDPAMPAPEAPVCWTTSAAAPILHAVCDRPVGGSAADLSFAGLRCARNLIVGPVGDENFILRDSDTAMILRLHGSRVSLAPVSATFFICGIPQPHKLAADFGTLYDLVHCPQRTMHHSRERLFLRDALVALDGRCLGASYRDMASVLYGAERARAEWSGVSRAMKDHMRRALAKGEGLRDAGHRRLLE